MYADVIDILETINKGSHDSGPLNLAVQFEIIKPNEISQVMSLKDYDASNFDIDTVPISKNLKKLYKGRTAADASKVVPLNHLVSSIAYTVVNKINTETNFSEAAADILNNSAFVQMYTEAKQKGDEFIIEGFNTIWPSKLFTEVTLEAQKSYSSTASSGGKLVFNINKDPKKVANTDSTGENDIVDYKPDPDKLNNFDQQRSDVTAAAGGVEEPKQLGNKKSLGRARRR